MGSRRWFFLFWIALFPCLICAQSASSPTGKRPAKKAPTAELEDGSVSSGVYHNNSLRLTCKIPAGWVSRTGEMNADTKEASQEADHPAEGTQPSQPAPSAGAKLLLAVFSRPPEARAADVNSSILIAAEPVTAYPGLKDAAQYFEPLTEVAKAQGFSVDEEPYEFSIGGKTLVRSDFHKDIGSRVMRQSTVAFLAHNYAVSVTVIGGTEDEVEDLLDGLEFPGSPRAEAPR